MGETGHQGNNSAVPLLLTPPGTLNIRLIVIVQLLHEKYVYALASEAKVKS